MAKALLGQYVRYDDRLVWEAARLRERVQDLQTLVRSLEEENTRLRGELETRRVADEMAIRLDSGLDGGLDGGLDSSLDRMDKVDLDQVTLASTS